MPQDEGIANSAGLVVRTVTQAEPMPHEVALRRRVPRQIVGWPGRYLIESVTDWEVCQVLDISLLGIGLELYGPVPDEIIGHRVVVEVETGAGTSLRLQLSGEVRNTRRGLEGMRVGLEFMGLSPVERSVLEALERLHVGW